MEFVSCSLPAEEYSFSLVEKFTRRFRAYVINNCTREEAPPRVPAKPLVSLSSRLSAVIPLAADKENDREKEKELLASDGREQREPKVTLCSCVDAVVTALVPHFVCLYLIPADSHSRSVTTAC
jgi:hypothetical protein